MQKKIEPLRTGVDIANMAVIGLSAPWAESGPGYCQKFARQVAERVGSVVGAAMDAHRAESAYQTMLNFRNTRFNIWERLSGEPMPVIQEGDFLYKDNILSGASGHVGIAINGRLFGESGGLVCVAENSSYHISHANEPHHNHNVSGAKGWRSLTRFGDFSMIVRLT